VDTFELELSVYVCLDICGKKLFDLRREFVADISVPLPIYMNAGVKRAGGRKDLLNIELRV
jgi:hypothetical protein